MDGTTMTTQTLTTSAADLAGGRRFTAALVRDADGEPQRLILAAGFRDADAWPVQDSALQLPADALPAIVAALQALG